MTEKDRNDRLAADFCGMLKIQDRPYVSWVATKGELPCAEEYLLTVRIRTYALSVRAGVSTVGVIRSCTVKVTLWPSYPNTAPDIRMLSLPPVFHPDWYSKGTYCSSEPWRSDTPLKDHVMRMIGTLIYQPDLMGTDTPANYKALDWYRKNSGRAELFPSDSLELTENSPEEVAAAEAAALSFDEIADSW